MMQGFKERSERELKTCPRCLQKLSWIEFMRRKKLKICRCGKCGRIIDERLMHW